MAAAFRQRCARRCIFFCWYLFEVVTADSDRKKALREAALECRATATRKKIVSAALEPSCFFFSLKKRVAKQECCRFERPIKLFENASRFVLSMSGKVFEQMQIGGAVLPLQLTREGHALSMTNLA